ncbi:hypothetical protein, partial [Raoultella planticola]
LVATLILWSGRRKYVHQPARGADPHSFLKVVWTALKAGGAGAAVAALGVIGAGYSLSRIGALGLVPAVCLALV